MKHEEFADLVNEVIAEDMEILDELSEEIDDMLKSIEEDRQKMEWSIFSKEYRELKKMEEGL